MEENNNNEKSVNAEELKNQTVNTAKQVKETMKNVNFKEETMVAKGTVVEMFKDPIGTVEKVAEDKENKFFKTSLYLIIVWAAIALLNKFFYGLSMRKIYDKDLGWVLSNHIFKLSTLWAVLAPVFIIGVYSIIAFVMNKNNKKELPEVASVVSISYLPVIFGKVIGLLTILSSDMSKITNPIQSILSTTTIVLLYFGLKKLFNENDDKKFIKTFVTIIALYEVVAFILQFMKIYI